MFFLIRLIIYLISASATHNRDSRSEDYHDRYRGGGDPRFVKRSSGPNVPLIILLTILGVGGLSVLGCFGICMLGGLNHSTYPRMAGTMPGGPSGSRLILAPIKLPLARASNRPVALRTSNVEDLTVTELRGVAAPCVCWNDTGTSFYTLDTAKGIITRVALAGFKEERRLETTQQCTWLSPSESGLLLTLPALGEIWVLDEESLAVIDRVAVPGVVRAVSAPELPTAFALCTDSSIWSVDLAEMQRSSHTFSTLTRGLERPIVSADGKYLFCSNKGGGPLHRFGITGQDLAYEDSSANGPRDESSSICVSADGTFVCMAVGDKVKEPTPIVVYRTANLKAAAFSLDADSSLTAVGFDPKAGKVYAADGAGSLFAFNQAGVQDKKYAKLAGPKAVLQCLVHPEGKKMLIVGEEKMFFVQ